MARLARARDRPDSSVRRHDPQCMSATFEHIDVAVRGDRDGARVDERTVDGPALLHTSEPPCPS